MLKRIAKIIGYLQSIVYFPSLPWLPSLSK